ncbi:MAG TPA: response regulator [Gemmatimonadales bacterium]
MHTPLEGLLPVPEDGPTDVAYWRLRILDATLLATAALGLLTLIPSALLLLREGRPLVVIMDLVAYGTILVVTFRKSLPYDFRARVLVGGTYLLSLVLITSVGPRGSGLHFLGAVPVLAALLFGLRAAVMALALQILTLVGFGAAIAAGAFAWLAPRYPDQLVIWTVVGVNLVFLSAILSLSISALLRGLEITIGKWRQGAEALQAERRSLEHAYATLERETTERANLEAQLRQSQKLEALGTLAGGIAHDFNNLLQPIMAQAEIVQSGLPPDHVDRQRLEDILLSAERARDLVRRILTFSRRAEPRRGALRLAEPVREVAALLRSTLPAGIHIDAVVRDEAAFIHAEGTEVIQMLMNLAMNSYHAMRREGGRLQIVVEDASVDDLVRLAVRDTGTGMDRATVERAFDPFFTTKEPGEGTGLGLSTVHGIVTALAGRIRLVSEPGAGTEVEMLFPRVQGPGAVAPTTLGRRPASARVLLVDDEASVLAVAGTQLRHLGYHVEAVQLPEAALDRIRRDPQAFDVLITDHGMPGMSGLALAQASRAVAPELPVILMTGYLDEPTRSDALEGAVSAVLPKPFRLGNLTEVLTKVLGTTEY